MAGMAAGWPAWLREHVWEIRFRRYVTLTLAIVLVAAGVWGGMTLAQGNRSCAPGVERPAGSDECVGVSTTAYDFGQRQLTDVIRAIDRENDSLASRARVTVAVFQPFSAADNDTLRELQGAYLAQYEANHHETGQTPAIRLVLANPGADSARWRETVDALARMTEGPDRLRAVTGIGSSTDTNKQAVRELTRRGIPVIGTSITADSLANGQNGKDPFPGLARVAPTNTDLARALTSSARISTDRAYLVYDKPGDPYTRTLRQSFERLLKGSPYQPSAFRPPRDRTQEGTTANTFRNITFNICDTPHTTDTILFAGRHTQLRQFVNALGRRGCLDRRFTVLTGDEGSYLTSDKELETSVLGRNLTVRYTALAHFDAWADDPPARGGSHADAQALTKLLAQARHEPVGPIGRTPLDGGQLTVAYDATRLAVKGIRQATPDGSRFPGLTDVGDVWPQLRGSLRVYGASGWLCLDNHGNPYDKAVPIVELTPAGGSKFVKLAWPEGKPPKEDCLPPA
ncbi:hypothetical protein [Streptomyces sp. NPDC127119]|uniref:hypothetical protein n=1 Tax=Streptomyces sp. NPDC127119 TaxID=3345370 RepID=UPI00363351AF